MFRCYLLNKLNIIYLILMIILLIMFKNVSFLNKRLALSFTNLSNQKLFGFYYRLCRNSKSLKKYYVLMYLNK